MHDSLGRNPERVSKESPGPSGPGAQKCPQQSRNSLRSLETVYLETLETVSRLFRTLFGLRGLPAPGESLETLSGFRAWTARETPVKASRGCNPEDPFLGHFGSEQRYLAPNLQFAAETLPTPRPPSWRTPPPPGFSINPPPPSHLGLPLPLPRAEKKVKNIRNVHQDFQSISVDFCSLEGVVSFHQISLIISVSFSLF